MAFVYLVRCADASLYVGWTEDVETRIAAHNEGRGGSYTSRRRPVTLAFVETHTTAESARRRERQIKRWSAAKKEALVSSDSDSLKQLSVSRSSPRSNTF
jgi:predicted GIY-YIG superfamily endonuclease